MSMESSLRHFHIKQNRTMKRGTWSGMRKNVLDGVNNASGNNPVRGKSFMDRRESP